MTKPEELARKISNDADLLGSAGCSRIQAQLETALKPLLDATKYVHTLLMVKAETDWTHYDWKQVDDLGELLSEWMPKP